MSALRWLFAGQLGPAFDDGGRILLIESRAAFGRAPIHRAKAHLLLSALRHRAAELGDRVDYRVASNFRAALAPGESLEVVDPISHAARRLVREVGATVLPSRGFVTDETDFADWVRGRENLVMEDFYRWSRRRTGILMDGDAPRGGRWNYDHDNRQSPPKGSTGLGLKPPYRPREDEIDEGVRRDLDTWAAAGEVTLVGADRPRRFPVTRVEALRALEDFVTHRLELFGPYEDAVLGDDWAMAHSLLSVPLNLGLLDPLEVIERVTAAGRSGVPLRSVEAVVRQLMGWRDWVWHLYWHLGPGYLRHNALGARRPLPVAVRELDGSALEAACLSESLDALAERGWLHHIQRLMVLGNWGLQRGWSPTEYTSWFQAMFVDGTPWVMPANVIGMALHADGGIVATKPYASGGAYLNRMTDHCRRCPFDPKIRVGEKACPVTAGYWAFLDRNRDVLAGNARMAQPLAGLDRLGDLDDVRRQEAARRRF